MLPSAAAGWFQGEAAVRSMLAGQPSVHCYSSSAMHGYQAMLISMVLTRQSATQFQKRPRLT